MTIRQHLLKLLYPVIMFFGKTFPASHSFISNGKNILPTVSFYSLSAKAIDGSTIDFSLFKGKKVLIINTASDCGFTAQYAELEKLHNRFKDSLVMIAFPANDFQHQESKENTSIEKFCKKNYGISFLIAAKSVVKKDKNQQVVFQWLTNPTQNGWCDKAPSWNFCKFLINEKGELTHFFASTVSPLDKKVLSAIEQQ